MRTRALVRPSGLVVAAAAAALLAAPTGAARVDGEVYRDPYAPVDARVDDLLRRMTLEEKVAQLLTVWQGKTEIFDAKLRFNARKAAERHPHGIGQFARPQDARGPVSPREIPSRSPRETVELVNAVQRYAIEQTRLGIPVLFHEESLHGYAAAAATIR